MTISAIIPVGENTTYIPNNQGKTMKNPIRIMFLLLTGIVACSLISTTSIAQDELVYIRAGTLVDVQTGELRKDQVISLRGERIESVDDADSVDIAVDANVIDLSDSWVMPGLIDMHDHLTGSSDYNGYEALQISVPREALFGVTNGMKTLQAGFTTVRNVGAAGFSDVALRDAINAGEIDGPRMRVSGPSIGITGGHCDNNLLPFEYDVSTEGIANGPWAVRAKVRELIKYGADVIKFCATGGVFSKGDSVGGQQYTFEEMQALVDEAHMHERKVAAHAHGPEGIKTAIRAGVDSIEHASMIDDEGILLAKENGTYLVMDIYNDTYILEYGESVGILQEFLDKERIIGQLQRDNHKKAFEAGVNMAFGSDGAVYPHGDNGRQFYYMVEYGMTPMQAIQAATVKAADLLGWPDDVGAVDDGFYADIIAVKENPMENIRVMENVSFVMKGGKIYKQ
jgi:imidazolonepropionase-like amidohydrolase